MVSQTSTIPCPLSPTDRFRKEEGEEEGEKEEEEEVGGEEGEGKVEDEAAAPQTEHAAVTLLHVAVVESE